MNAISDEFPFIDSEDNFSDELPAQSRLVLVGWEYCCYIGKPKLTLKFQRI